MIGDYLRHYFGTPLVPVLPLDHAPDPDYGDIFMVLDLERVDHARVPGIYGKTKDRFARRLAFLHPLAHTAFLKLQEDSGRNIVISDMWRASLSSLMRKYPAGRPVHRGTKPPAYSGHNYGLSIDPDVGRTMRRMKMTKPELDSYMAGAGWHCHRRDGKRKREEWHYNYLGTGEDAKKWLAYARRSTAGAVEARIKSLYSPYWSPSKEQLQRYLQYLSIYDREIDGIIGKRTRAAARVFQGAWHLKVDGIAGPRTCRTLAFRCAELRHPLLSLVRNVQERIT